MVTQMQKDGLLYVRNAAGNATKASFLDDFDPVGGMLLSDITRARLVELVDGRLVLTETGKEAIA